MVSEEQKDRLFALFVVAVALAFVTIGALGSRTSAKESAEIDGAFDQPEREFRGVWIATAWRLDWPREHYDVEEQRRLLQVIFDRHRATGVNAVFFQVRPSSDAMYASELEPWSKYLTGLQGMPPEPFYDPLAFAIDEANARGMELHAWVNPFRANAMSAVIIDDLHISKRRPEWIVEYALAEYVNPGIPEAREYVVDVIEDIVRRYDVDGVHFDDYFYPYPEGDALFDDTAAFEADPRGFEDIADWRRDNVNLFIQACAARIRDVDSSVRFSVSPYGAWKDDEPPGTRTFPAYDRLYCDAVAWLDNQWVDFLVPQLYWKAGEGSGLFERYLEWWMGRANGRHIYAGLPAFRLETKAGDWSANEILDQIDVYRAVGCRGSALFSSRDVANNIKAIAVRLAAGPFRRIALPPAYPWIDDEPPPPPSNARFDNGRTALRWDAPRGETPRWYAVYAGSGSGKRLLAVLPNDARTYDASSAPNDARLSVAAVDRANNVSELVVPE
jgi:uncharacterized lipoprotein YddW (UPF0748 family)